MSCCTYVYFKVHDIKEIKDICRESCRDYLTLISDKSYWNKKTHEDSKLEYFDFLKMENYDWVPEQEIENGYFIYGSDKKKIPYSQISFSDEKKMVDRSIKYLKHIIDKCQTIQDVEEYILSNEELKETFHTMTATSRNLLYHEKSGNFYFERQFDSEWPVDKGFRTRHIYIMNKFPLEYKTSPEGKCPLGWNNANDLIEFYKWYKEQYPDECKVTVNLDTGMKEYPAYYWVKDDDFDNARHFPCEIGEEFYNSIREFFNQWQPEEVLVVIS